MKDVIVRGTARPWTATGQSLGTDHDTPEERAERVRANAERVDAAMTALEGPDWAEKKAKAGQFGSVDRTACRFCGSGNGHAKGCTRPRQNPKRRPCARCRDVHPVSCFRYIRNRHGKLRLQSWCRMCEAEAKRISRQASCPGV